MFHWLDRGCARLVQEGFGLSMDSRLGGSLHFFLYDTVKILMLLSVMIFAVSWIRSWFPPRKTKALLERIHGAPAHLAASLLGIVTPFCSCSSIPIFIGFVEAGIPLGVTFSFLITSPIVNEAAFAILWATFGWKIATAYAAAGVSIGVVSGLLLGRVHPERYLEEGVLDGAAFDQIPPDLKTKDRLAFAARQTRHIVRRIWIFLMIGIAIGAMLHGWAPEELLARVAGRDQPLGLVVAVLCGVPLYANALGTIPIAEALIGKGVGTGTALAFMMSVTALSLPEMVLLRKVMQPRLLAVFAATATLGILLVGFGFNFFF